MFSCLGAAAVAADPTSPDTITVPTLAAPPSMQGTIDVSWDPAAKLTLGQDFTYRRPAAEQTDVRVAQDSTGLDIAFIVTQTEPVVAAPADQRIERDERRLRRRVSVSARHGRLPVRVLRQSGRHALPDLEREQCLHAAVDGDRARDADRLRRHDAHPARRDSQRRLDDVARPVRPRDRRDERPGDLDVLAAREQRRRSGVRRDARRRRREARRRGASQTARADLRAGRGDDAGLRREHLAHRRRLLAAGHAERLVRRDAAPRLLQRRGRPADDRAVRLRLPVRRGAAVLHPGRTGVQLQLLVLGLRHAALHAGDPDLPRRLCARGHAGSGDLRRVRRDRRRPGRPRPGLRLQQGDDRKLLQRQPAADRGRHVERTARRAQLVPGRDQQPARRISSCTATSRSSAAAW